MWKTFGCSHIMQEKVAIQWLFFVKHHMLNSLVSIEWNHRAGMIALQTLSQRTPFLVVGTHVPHGDMIHDTLADISALLHRHSKQCPFYALGDFNTDFAPVHANDLYANVRG